MKKKNIIILIIVSILVILGLTILYLFIPTDTFNETAMELYEDHSPVCYNIEEQENSIVFTFYHGYDEIKDNITKQKTIYEFENDVLISLSKEIHCRNNLIAMIEYESNNPDLINCSRKGNVIYGKHELWEDIRGNTKQQIMDKMINIYESTYILIEE